MPNKAASFERLLSVKETAQALDVSEKTVRRMITAGRLQTLRVGRLHRIRPETLRHLLSGGRI